MLDLTLQDVDVVDYGNGSISIDGTLFSLDEISPEGGDDLDYDDSTDDLNSTYEEFFQEVSANLSASSNSSENWVYN